MDWRLLRWAVPVAIVLVGYWLLAPLLAPGLAPTQPPVAEAPVDRPVSTRPPGSSVAVAVPVGPVTKATPLTPRAEATQAATATAAPSATPAVYRASTVENLKIEPGATEIVRLGRIEQGTIVRLSVSVRFNVGISNLSGVPDVDLQVVGPSGTVATHPNAKDGLQVRFEAPATGEYELRLDNSRSRINAKRVTVQFG
jgi:hypothetical protein